LWQANTVSERLAASSAVGCRIVVIRTSGDRLQEAPLSDSGGKRLFVKELEDALLNREIDLAVHSSKDMPVVLPDGLAIAAALPREDPRDAIVLPAGSGFNRSDDDLASVEELRARLGPSPPIGTSSVRRIAQLSRLFPAARFAPIRGNLDTRLRKLDEGQFGALVLATAGLKRLGFSARVSWTLSPAECVPAPGQGIVAVEIRSDDEGMRQLLAPISDRDATAALEAERALVAALGGGCQTPIGAMATVSGRTIELVAVVASPDGSRSVRAEGQGTVEDVEKLGVHVAAELAARGAEEILAESRVN
jgi:hydroxymethylbilane synthase